MSIAPEQTAPDQTSSTAPDRTAPHQTPSDRTAPDRTLELPDTIAALPRLPFEFGAAAWREADEVCALEPAALFHRLMRDQEAESTLLVARRVLDAFLGADVPGGTPPEDADGIAAHVATARTALAEVIGSLATVKPHVREAVLRQRAPLGLLAGKPILGEGYLELDPRFPAAFSMDATGLFTTDLPDKTPTDKIVRQPYELAEEALRDMSIKTLRIDLFRRELADTPIRLEFSGTSQTQETRVRAGRLIVSRESITVPVTIVTNVKGSFSEALNFLMRLATL